MNHTNFVGVVTICKKSLLALLIVTGLSAQAFAISPAQVLDGKFEDNLNLGQRILRLFLLNTDYQLGDEWGKKPVTDEDISSGGVFARMALATANVRKGGTGFYLGRFAGQHIVATNHHVCENAAVCSGAKAIVFTKLGITTRVTEFFGSWTDVDLALFAIEVKDQATEEKLMAVAQPFVFNARIYPKQALVTIGFGVGNNPGRQLVANRDSDCLVFSNENDFRFMADPDEFNPGPYKAWSFSTGCDVSHGDSGSAMMDRETGSVVGIIWTGRIPKNKRVQSSEYLQTLFSNPNNDIWTELSYAVPAPKIGEYLHNLVSEGKSLSPSATAAITDMLTE